MNNSQEKFTGKLYSKTQNGTLCQIVSTDSTLNVLVNNDIQERLQYQHLNLEYSGTNKKYIKITSINNDNLSLLTNNKNIVESFKNRPFSSNIQSQVDNLQKLKRKRIFTKTFVFSTIVTFLLLLIAGFVTIASTTIGFTVNKIPPELEASLGEQASKSILESKVVCEDEQLNHAITLIGRRLVSNMDANSINWNIKIINDDQINAFALPGGYIFINSGLIENSNSPEEIAGVLAHEFTHVTKRHGLKNVVANAGIRIAIYLFLGANDAVSAFFIENATSLASMKFSREQENEADTGSFKIMKRSKIDQSGFITFMEDNNSMMPAILSTHPPSNERIENARTFIKHNPYSSEKFKIEWQKLKNNCKNF